MDLLLVFLVFFFFFQAEDGIRDGHVTGVQTCALPIFFISAVSTRFLSILYEKNVPHMIIYVNRNVLEGRIRESTMAGKNINTRQTTNVIKLIRRINQKLNSMGT